MASDAHSVLERYFEHTHRRAYPAGATIISAGDMANRRIRELEFCSSSLPSTRFRSGQLAMVPGDRDDILIGAALATMNGVELAGVLMTDGLQPSAETAQLCEEAVARGLPILSVESDTWATARHLHERKAGKLIIANRTVSRAHDLAAQFGGYGIGLDEIAMHLAEADIVIASTGSTTALLDKATVEAALRTRKHRPVLMIDIAVPPDIDPGVAEFDDVYLYTVDDLKQVIEENMRSRQEAADQAEEIVEAQADRFMAWTRSLDAVPTLRAYREHAEALGQAEAGRALRALAGGNPPDEVIERLARDLVRKLTHEPCVNMRAAVAEGETEMLDAIRTLFNLDIEDCD